MTNLKLNQMYYGPHEERRVVLGINASTARILLPVSLQEIEMSIEDIEIFTTGSNRRTYQDLDGEIRTKIKEDKKLVTYQTPDRQIIEVKKKDWDKWRSKIKN